MSKKSVVVLVSGSGSNLQAIMDAAAQSDGFQIAGVLSNRADAYGLVRAANAGIPTALIDHTLYANRETFDAALIEQIDAWQADLVVLAGFMRILTDGFVEHYNGRLVNIHPSLLPKFKGLNTHARALEAGEAEHGCTVHFVCPELDAGAPIVQAATTIRADDNVESLQQRIHHLEHCIYPLAVEWFVSERLTQRRGLAFLDGEQLPPGGKRFEADL
jgi:phosphoribosylglycinamide formyltransferase-1